jgi:hypothetical protein
MIESERITFFMSIGLLNCKKWLPAQMQAAIPILKRYKKII